MPEDLRELLQLNQKVYVSRGGEDDYYVSSVQDIEPDAIYIGLPMSQSLTLVLSRGDRVQVRFTKEDASYVFVTAVLRVREDEIPLYGLAWPERVERQQLRRYVRLPCLLDVRYAEPPPGAKPPAWRDGRAVDISAGGLRLQTDRLYQPGTVLLLKFELPLRGQALEIETRARVVRRQSEELPGAKGKTIYRYGMEFLDLRERQQDRIMSFVFWKMAESRRVK